MKQNTVEAHIEIRQSGIKPTFIWQVSSLRTEPNGKLKLSFLKEFVAMPGLPNQAWGPDDHSVGKIQVYLPRFEVQRQKYRTNQIKD